MRYLLELRSATKVDTGVYRWSFSERNLFRPNTVTIGPCSVTAENDLRNVVLLSNTFRNSDMPHVNRSDALKPVLTVIYPEMRSTHSPDASSAGAGASSGAELGSDAAIDEIDASGDLLCWVDLDNTRVLDQSFQQATGAGFSNAYYIYKHNAHVDCGIRDWHDSSELPRGWHWYRGPHKDRILGKRSRLHTDFHCTATGKL